MTSMQCLFFFIILIRNVLGITFNFGVSGLIVDIFLQEDLESQVTTFSFSTENNSLTFRKKYTNPPFRQHFIKPKGAEVVAFTKNSVSILKVDENTFEFTKSLYTLAGLYALRGIGISAEGNHVTFSSTTEDGISNFNVIKWNDGNFTLNFIEGDNTCIGKFAVFSNDSKNIFCQGFASPYLDDISEFKIDAVRGISFNGYLGLPQDFADQGTFLSILGIASNSANSQIYGVNNVGILWSSENNKTIYVPVNPKAVFVSNDAKFIYIQSYDQFISFPLDVSNGDIILTYNSVSSFCQFQTTSYGYFISVCPSSKKDEKIIAVHKRHEGTGLPIHPAIANATFGVEIKANNSILDDVQLIVVGQSILDTWY